MGAKSRGNSELLLQLCGVMCLLREKFGINLVLCGTPCWPHVVFQKSVFSPPTGCILNRHLGVKGFCNLG